MIQQDQEEIIAWLRGEEGTLWSLLRIGESLDNHGPFSGAFADVIDDGEWHAAARWPDPGPDWDLGVLDFLASVEF